MMIAVGAVVVVVLSGQWKSVPIGNSVARLCKTERETESIKVTGDDDSRYYR